jgi:hypothetical protein
MPVALAEAVGIWLNDGGLDTSRFRRTDESAFRRGSSSRDVLPMIHCTTVSEAE